MISVKFRMIRSTSSSKPLAVSPLSLSGVGSNVRGTERTTAGQQWVKGGIMLQSLLHLVLMLPEMLLSPWSPLLSQTMPGGCSV